MKQFVRGLCTVLAACLLAGCAPAHVEYVTAIPKVDAPWDARQNPEGGQPTFTVAAADGLRMRSGPGTDYGRVATVPTGTQVTALGVDGTDGWILVQYNGAYGWLTKQYLTAN